MKGDIRDLSLVSRILEEHRHSGMLHLAAESHVDRSIDGPEEFIQTNIVGTHRLLASALRAPTGADPRKSALAVQSFFSDEHCKALWQEVFCPTEALSAHTCAR